MQRHKLLQVLQIHLEMLLKRLQVNKVIMVVLVIYLQVVVNMPTILSNAANDPTVRIFDSFYNIDVTVNASEYELVQAFFNGVCETQNQAKQFTAFLFRVATESGIPAQELLAEMQSMKTDNITINQFLIFYLNSFRPKTGLYGIGTEPTPVYPVARNVVR